MLSLGGIVWACADGGWDNTEASNFAPEAFVAKEYSPFFYTSYVSYYNLGYDDNNTTRYNDVVLKEWDSYLGQGLADKDLKVLLFKSSYGALDSIYRYYDGKLNVLPKGMPDLKSSKLTKKQVDALMSYLLLAKECETFAVSDIINYWDVKPVGVVPPSNLEEDLSKSLDQSKDTFIKQRLWFQLVRYHYFAELPTIKPDSLNMEKTNPSAIVSAFDKYESKFPKNSIYYRAMGYVAGHFYKTRNYAQANYLYSLCYNSATEAKISSEWSFHPQNESDWQKSLGLAKNTEEKITLWQLLGINSDPGRAIEKIYSLNPKSEKLDLLLSRLVNIAEIPTYGPYAWEENDAKQKTALAESTTLVSKIAEKGNTNKPYYWNLAAGYLQTLSGHNDLAKGFYSKAKPQLPANDPLILAQYKLLDWTLYLSTLKTIDAKAESEMVEPINWLADLRDRKDTVANLRYYRAVEHSIKTLAGLYKKQGNLLKSNCFESNTAFYANNTNIENLKALINKSSKTPFEKAMLRYYHLTAEDLNYHQGLMLVYQEKTDQAIQFMDKSGKLGEFVLPGNPFYMRLNDCHDCDFEAVQKKKYTALGFVSTIKNIKSEIVAGRNLYANTYALANAYYNITHYGNARTFYQTEITGSNATSSLDISPVFRVQFTSSKIAEKYYLMARNFAKTPEQKAKCTFMAAKCERNGIYNKVFEQDTAANKYYWSFDFDKIPTWGAHFAELRAKYSHTEYYKEVLRECGYFNTYLYRVK